MKRKNPQILILVGIPGSGKSTFARYFIRTEENWMRLCRDDFRMMHFTYSNLESKSEIMITEMVDAALDALLRKRMNVLIDATHCKAEYIEHYIDKFNHQADISFKVFDIDPQIAEERCEKRYAETGKHISRGVLNKYRKEFKDLCQSFDFSPRPKISIIDVVISQDKSLPKAIICDLDGTLALMNGRDPFDASRADEDILNEPVANTLQMFAKEGYEILLVSGREEIYREPTEKFLEKHDIHYDELWMREKRDYRKDAIVKYEIFNRQISGRYYIEFVLDDRNQVVDMWRKEAKLPCFQVNYGDF